jgi:LppP/LprE lipoprotein
MRLLGVTATSALLAIFAWVLLSIYAERKGTESAVQEGPTATPAPAAAKKEKAKAKADTPKLTPSQRRDRAAAVATLGGLGYRPVTVKTYSPDHVLRVLIGKGEGGRRAFFFAGSKYLGNDTADDSAAIQVVRAGNRSVSLSYRLFAEDDRPCCPTGAKVRVLFRWDGETLAPQTAIPPAAQRRAPAA